MDEIYLTKYYGIYVQQDVDGYWLYSDNDFETYFDHYPTTCEIETFRNRAVK